MSVKKELPSRRSAKAEAPITSQSAAERRSAEAELRSLTTKFAPTRLRLIAAMRRSLQQRLPTAHELVYEYRNWFVISYSPSERGHEGVLAIRADGDGVKLYFNQGKGLPDPEKLLQGSSQTRWIGIDRASALTQPAVVDLMEAAIDHNSIPFAPAGRGSIIIRS